MAETQTRIAVIGSTGSIGTQTLEVVATDPDRYRVVALAARSSVEVLAEQARRVHPEVVAVADEGAAAELARLVPAGVEVMAGEGSLAEVAPLGDVVVNGVVGFVGLRVTLAALEGGRRLALANKESLIAGGPVVQRARQTPGCELIPVDSEHAAVHQCLHAGPLERVERVLLTASGGPFRGRSRSDLEDVGIEDALAHPTWQMGPKITVDSSTLMNKGLEVIEAHELFGIDYDRIEVVVHPQSVVHSMVEFSDGSTIAQLSMPDMRLPIGYALAFPDRITTSFGRIDWHRLGRLDFEPPDLTAFPCLTLAYEAGRAGGTAPAWLNAANEVAVEAFLKNALRWTGIADVLMEMLSRHDGAPADSVDAVVEADRRAREATRRVIERKSAA